MDEIFIKSTIILIGIIIVLVWLLTNTYSLRERLRIIFTTKAFFWTLTEITIIVPQIFYPVVLPFPYSPFDEITTFTGMLIYIFGAAFSIWARLTIGKNWGVPGQHDINKQKKLVTNGPYAFSRNPIYLGLLVMLIGFELALGSLLIILVIPFFIFMRRSILVEEKLLKRHFGKEYISYKQKVPRFLLKI